MTITILFLRHSMCYVSLSCLLQKQTIDCNKKHEWMVLNSDSDGSMYIVGSPKDGIIWRGLFPLLFATSKKLSRSCVDAIIDMKYPEGTATISKQLVSPLEMERLMAQNHTRLIHSKRSNVLIVVPPMLTTLQSFFCSLLIHYEHIWLQMVTLNAWIATLGGGYFLCRHLETAVCLAQQQRTVALWMGDQSTADKCTLNEAFNYIHAGGFRIALAKIKAVKASSKARNDALTLNMCYSAQLFLKRVRKAAMFESNSETNDDYQRIRIVQDRSRQRRNGRGVGSFNRYNTLSK